MCLAYAQKIDVLWEARPESEIFVLTASPELPAYLIFELKFAQDPIKGKGGAFRSYYTRSTPVEGPPSVEIMEVSHYSDSDVALATLRNNLD